MQIIQSGISSDPSEHACACADTLVEPVVALLGNDQLEPPIGTEKMSNRWRR